MLAVVDLKHLNLRVRDAERCRAFYERHFHFAPDFEAEGGYFLRNRDGFLLALIPVAPHQPLPEGFHIGFTVTEPDELDHLRHALSTDGVRTTAVEDFRPGESYATFRCWDPDDTEIEVFWEGP